METHRARTVSIDNAASRLDELADRAGAGAPVHLKRGRKVVAVLVSPEDAETVARERREMEADVRAAKRALRAFERDGRRTVPIEKVMRRYGLKTAR